jgi:hypothetical protein
MYMCLLRAAIVKDAIPFTPTEQATRPAGVLCGMRCGDVVPPNGSDVHRRTYIKVLLSNWSFVIGKMDICTFCHNTPP